MQCFGGLEEYAANLAIGLKQRGQAISYMSMAWSILKINILAGSWQIVFPSYDRRNGFRNLVQI